LAILLILLEKKLHLEQLEKIKLEKDYFARKLNKKPSLTNHQKT